MIFSSFGRTAIFCTKIFSLLVLCNGQINSSNISSAMACRRWRHSSVVFENTLLIYGGNAWRQSPETGNRNSTINRDFISLDLSKDFVITDAPFLGLPIPPSPGPAKVLQGSFWEVDSKITFYGGSFSPNPRDRADVVEPFSLWSYHPPTSQWQEEEAKGDPVLRASNGASAYYKGIGYYRGGQLDNLTNPDWPDGDGSRVILSGMLKVDLATSTFTNETRATGFDAFVFQDPNNTGFQYRDGNLIPITFNKKDYLVNFSGGGPRGHALPLENVYIYDIEASTWYRQPVSGNAPANTRGACAVANYAPDNSSIQITFFGGVIYNQEIQDFEATSDTWVLSIPSFTWVPVDAVNPNIGPGSRQEHTCHLKGSQMLVIGGRNSSNICEGSGLWVLDTATMEWQNSFTTNKSYTVPTSVSSIIGGNSNGGASWDNLPAIRPPDSNSPFYDISGSNNATKKAPSAGVIAGSIIGGLLLIGAVGLVIWHLYKRNRRRELDLAPIPPPGEDEVPKVAYPGNSHGISELASPTPSSQAPRYSTLSGYEPAQLAGDSSFPVELYSPPLGHELSQAAGSMGVYEVQNENKIGDASTTSTGHERDETTNERLEEVPVPPPAETAGRS